MDRRLQRFPSSCRLRQSGKRGRIFFPLKFLPALLLLQFCGWGFFFSSGAAGQTKTGQGAQHRAVFVCFNVQNYVIHPPETSRTRVKAEVEREAVAEVLASLAPSMVGLVEIGCAESLDDLQERLAKRGIVLPHKVLVNGPDIARRLGFLSAFPILENHSREHVPLELAGKASAMQRGILDIIVALPEGMPLRLVGLHLKSKRDVPDLDQDALRSREAREVRRHLDNILKETPGLPLLVWGDFNLSKNEPAWRTIAEAGGSSQALQPLEAVDQQGLKWTHHWEDADLYSRIDFLLASPTANAMIQPGSATIADHTLRNLASDHRPLAATISWK